MNFVFGNAVFVHTHIYRQGVVTHSHPYNHQGHHTHDAATLNLISQANIIGSTITPQNILYVDTQPITYTSLRPETTLLGFTDARVIGALTLRAPPMAA